MTTVSFASQEDFQAYRNFDPHSEYIDPNRIKGKIANNEIIIAQEDEQIIGLIRLSYIWSTRPYLEFIFVDEKHRGQGISSQLLSFLIKYLVENGHAYLISSSEALEQEAQVWHHKQGFEPIGRLEKLNLPHDDSAEIFFTKKISGETALRRYERY